MEARRSSASSCLSRSVRVMSPVPRDQPANGRNTWMPSSPLQEPARGGACFGSSTFSLSSWRQETCQKSADSCSTHRRWRVDPLLTEAQEVPPTAEDSAWRSAGSIQKSPAHQMGKILGKYLLLALSEEETAALTNSMRQIGLGTPGGAEALAIFYQLLYDEWMAGSLTGPLARMGVDEKNGFGMIDWQAVREAASRFFSPSTRQQQRGIIETCFMLNKKGSRQCSRIAVQSKETSKAP